MPFPARSVFRLVLLSFALACLTSSAFAWEELHVTMHQASISVEKDGKGQVHHELGVKIRGGPVQQIVLPGVGETLEFLPDGQVTRARAGGASAWPLALEKNEDGALILRILADRGLRGGTYIFRFGYRVDFEARGLLKVGKRGASISWVTPRFFSGVNSDKAVFSIPHQEQPPFFEPVDDGELRGVLFSELRRGAERDEIELVRAYLAAGEPAVYQAQIPPGIFQGPAVAQVPGSREVIRSIAASGSPQVRGVQVAVGLGLFLGLLLLIKAREVELDALVAQALPRPLLPGGRYLRATLGALAAAAAGYFCMNFQAREASIAAVVYALLATFLFAARRKKARGPGKWVAVAEEPAGEFAEHKFIQLRKWRLFELQRPLGAFFFLAILAVVFVSAWRNLHSSHYLALASLASLLLLLPLFFTGTRASLPKTPAEQVEPIFSILRARLERLPLSLELWGRRALAIDGQSAKWVEGGDFDEMRIRLLPDQAPQGLRAFEISFDELSGAAVTPCLLIRVQDESAAHRLLPESITWRRAARADEKVAILTLRSGSQDELIRLIAGLLKALARKPESQRASSRPASSKPSASYSSRPLSSSAKRPSSSTSARKSSASSAFA